MWTSSYQKNYDHGESFRAIASVLFIIHGVVVMLLAIFAVFLLSSISHSVASFSQQPNKHEELTALFTAAEMKLLSVWVGAVGGFLSIAYLAASRWIRKRKHRPILWALSALALVFLPFGTLAGGVGIYCLLDDK